MPQSLLTLAQWDCLQRVLSHGHHLDKHSYSDLKLGHTAPKRHGLALNLELSDLSGFTCQQAPRDPCVTIAYVLRLQECTRIPDFLKYKCGSKFSGTKQFCYWTITPPFFFIHQISLWNNILCGYDIYHQNHTGKIYIPPIKFIFVTIKIKETIIFNLF